MTDDQELLHVLLGPRQFAADWLIIHAQDLASAAERRASANLLIFACLEARNAIEQLKGLWGRVLTFDIAASRASAIGLKG